MLLGAVAYLMNEGIIRNYAALPLEESEKMIHHPDGRILYSMLKKLLTEKELRTLEAQVTVLNEEKDKLRESSGIKI
jgi:glycine betaine/choline ABC-type transport system substrate-binding protein